jgi:hypothetical protein
LIIKVTDKKHRQITDKKHRQITDKNGLTVMDTILDFSGSKKQKIEYLNFDFYV